jgi:hypothetical protein
VALAFVSTDKIGITAESAGSEGRVCMEAVAGFVSTKRRGHDAKFARVVLFVTI